MVKKEAWVVSVDMGYGHQRAAYALMDIAHERIITANSEKIVSPHERRMWSRFQGSYEFLSRMSQVPFIGYPLWKAYDNFQSIATYYPKRDLSKPNFASLYETHLVKNGFCRSVVEYTQKKVLPFVSTFYIPAIAAEKAGLRDIYCIVTDTDINRVWAPLSSKETRICYLTPTTHATERIKDYGVPPQNVFYTGFPLPPENTKTTKADMSRRLYNLDPFKKYTTIYRDILHREGIVVKKSDHPLTITYAVGGAGAQKNFAAPLLNSLKNKIVAHKLRINLVAGTRLEVNQYFLNLINEVGLQPELGKYVNILCTVDKKQYFAEFSKLLHTTDILWTKPSELVFYAALGIPIILTDPLGAHEQFNKDWLIKKGVGFVQENPAFANEWLFEWVEKGMLAEAAFDAYTKCPRFGTENIKLVIFAKDKSKIKMKY